MCLTDLVGECPCVEVTEGGREVTTSELSEGPGGRTGWVGKEIGASRRLVPVEETVEEGRGEKGSRVGGVVRSMAAVSQHRVCESKRGRVESASYD